MSSRVAECASHAAGGLPELPVGADRATPALGSG
jgi:hypothetical protein